MTFVPIFVAGMGTSLALGGWRTRFRARAFPIGIVYGKPLDFADRRNRPHSPEPDQEAANRCMDAPSQSAPSIPGTTAASSHASGRRLWLFGA